jgi:transcriptional regulator with GAF, ATPase, and Fis domain
MPAVWLKFFDSLEGSTIESVTEILRNSGVEVIHGPDGTSTFGLVLLRTVSPELIEWLQDSTRHATILAIASGDRSLSAEETWRLMAAGAADVLVWAQLPNLAEDISARLARLQQINALMNSPAIHRALAGDSRCWRSALREIVEVSAFTQTSVLITGESGTGKELLAQLLHQLDTRREKGDLVILDCTTITPELAGSEFFGHERGAFTGAVSARDGAFAQANGGTLFLDEVGELPLPLQAQLLRVVQEHKYKRVGSNIWQHTEFRLVCATNRDLDATVGEGRFRADLYHRIAGWVCKVPPLRDRPEDILPLTAHFLSALCRTASPPPLDAVVQKYLLMRSYPGNVRDLRQLVNRIWHRHTGSGAITPGDIPESERPEAKLVEAQWPDATFEIAVRKALELGIGLKDLRRIASETAIRLALERERDNVHRAAGRLGVTDRALQIWRATHRRAGPDRINEPIL